MSCETANATLSYGSSTSTTITLSPYIPTQEKKVGNKDNNAGKWYLKAQGAKTGLTKSTGYEVAFKTVLHTSMEALSGDSIWFRGGDSPAGAVAAPGFPLSWDVGDYAGIVCRMIHI